MRPRFVADALWVRLSCVPAPLFEVGPYLALGFLLDAFPPVQRFMAERHGDFIFGLMGGLSILTLVMPRGRRDGWPGWMKAWGLGIFLSSLSLDGTQGFLSGLLEGAGRPGLNPLPDMNPWQHFLTLLLLSLLLGVAFYQIAIHRVEAERQRRLADLAAQAALRSRLAPHFIFNALNTLHAQIETDPRGAQATTERLASLFRQVVAVADQPTIPLKQELAFVEAYLGIEQARLGDRLRVEVAVPEDLEAAQLPPLSLQVLVENAIKHGVAPLERGGTVCIGAARDLLGLQVWVEDPGPGLSTQRGTGTALDTLRQRLDRPEDLTMGMEDGRHRVTIRWRQA